MLFQLTFAEECLTMHGAYKVGALHDELGRDYTFLIDHERCYFSISEIKADIAPKLDVDVSEIDIEEV